MAAVFSPRIARGCWAVFIPLTLGPPQSNAATGGVAAMPPDLPPHNRKLHAYTRTHAYIHTCIHAYMHASSFSSVFSVFGHASIRWFFIFSVLFYLGPRTLFLFRFLVAKSVFFFSAPDLLLYSMKTVSGSRTNHKLLCQYCVMCVNL